MAKAALIRRTPKKSAQPSVALNRKKQAQPEKAPNRKKNISKKKQRGAKGKKSWKLKLFMGALWLGLVLALCAGLYVYYCYRTLPDFSKAVYVERQAGVKILAADGREITSYGALFAEPVDVDDLPPYVYQAVIDTEDRRFFKHGGFDYIGFARAMAVNIAKMRYAQGASTITQQVAKNLFLTREKSIRRKVQEYLLAQWLEKHFSKKQILNIYLNRVFFGSGAYGLNTAAKRFFNKQAKDLNLREAAILAGALKAPSKYNYLRNKKLALERSEVVLKLMRRAGSISLKEWESAIDLPIGEADDGKILGARYFGDYVMGLLPDVVQTGDEDIYVKTTLDYDLQQRAEYILRKYIRANRQNNVSEGAVFVLGRKGENTAMAGGKEYKLSELATVEKGQMPQEVAKENQQYRLCLQYEYIGASEQGNKLLKKDLEEFNELLPMGYKAEAESNNWSWGGGANKQYRLLLIVIAIIFFITSILINSLKQPLALIFVIPISYIGVFLTFYWFKLNFDQGGFASFILLCGITVNASIYILNEYNAIRKRFPCLSPLRAYVKAWNTKVIPIFLTVVSTILGFIPFMVGAEKEGFWFPLAAGTIGGLVMSVIGVFIFLPVLTLNKKKMMVKKP